MNLLKFHRPIRVLRVITWLPIGGIERRLVAVLPRLNKELFDVQVVCIHKRGVLAKELENAGIPVHCIPFRKRWDLKALKALAQLMHREKIDIVHSHMYRSNVPATVAARMAGIRVVWGQVHNVGTWETRRQRWMDRLISKKRTGMLAVSERVRQDVIRNLHLAPERVRVIYNGIELDRFSLAVTQREAFREQFGLDDHAVVFVSAARLVEQKRTCDFLAAFGRLQTAIGEKSEFCPKAWILGDGPLLDTLKAQVEQLPNPQSVTFFGAVNDVERYLAAADVFVLPSTKEGFSNAIVEAMASGLPIIASDVGGANEAVREGVDGFLFQPLDIDALEFSMTKLFFEASLRQEMSMAAKQYAQQFSLEKMIEQIESLYLESMQPWG